MSPIRLKLSIVVPIRDEGDIGTCVLSELNEFFHHHLPGQFEILIVDDGSLLPVQYPANCPGRQWRFETPQGSGNARKLATLESSAEWVAWIDADGTYPIEDLWKLWLRRSEADQIIGSRSVDYGNWRHFRLLAKSLASLGASILFSHRIADINSGLRLFRRVSSEAWLHKLPEGFSCTTTATLGALINGQTLKFEPIEYRPRAHGSKSKFRPLTDGFLLFRRILELRFQ